MRKDGNCHQIVTRGKKGFYYISLINNDYNSENSIRTELLKASIYLVVILMVSSFLQLTAKSYKKKATFDKKTFVILSKVNPS